MPEEKLSRAERRRRERGIYPCANSDCNKRIKLSKSKFGYCNTCWSKLPPDIKAQHEKMLQDWASAHLME